jgi:hypothetical protein
MLNISATAAAAHATHDAPDAQQEEDNTNDDKRPNGQETSVVIAEFDTVATGTLGIIITSLEWAKIFHSFISVFAGLGKANHSCGKNCSAQRFWGHLLLFIIKITNIHHTNFQD